MKKISKTKQSLCLAIFSASILGITGCGGDGFNSGFEGAVYAMNNAAGNNQIASYGRRSNGTLEFISNTSTTGAGTGPVSVVPGPGNNTVDPLASNYALTMSSDNRFVFAVNAGSADVSSFVVNSDKSLTLVNTVSSGGAQPISVASYGNTVYTVNVNTGMASLQGFSISDNGTLAPIGGASYPLTGRATAIRFTENGAHLVAVEINTNRLHVFTRNTNNTLTMGTAFTYPAPVTGRNVANPFGVETFTRGNNQYAVIAEARAFAVGGTAPDLQTSSISTFQVNNNASLTPISLDVRTDIDGDDTEGPLASCWVVADSAGEYFYTANTNTNNISSFTATKTGAVALEASVAAQLAGTVIATGVTDQATVGNYLYQLLGAAGSVVSYSLDGGNMTEIDRDTGLATTGGNQGVTGF